MTLDSTRAVLLAGILSFSVLTVYTQYVFLETTDHVTNRPFRDTSLDQYHEILEGRRPFPYQWRVAGPWLVRLGEVLTGRDPHQIDVVVKVTALAASALLVMRFTALWAAPLATITAGALYFAITAAACASEGYSIYYTNDFLMVTGWFAAVYLTARRRYGWAAAVTFVTAWAKETVVLVPILITLEWWRGRANARDWLICAAAFLLPTVFLRVWYPAPIEHWAWWGNVMHNGARDIVKVLVFFNVLLVLGYRAFRRTSEDFLRELVFVGLLYAAMAYVVVLVRELRHFLPLVIIVIPLAIMELEQMLRAPGPDRRPGVPIST